MRELRKDPVTERWVIISTERANRPQPSAASAAATASEPCPFCPGNEKLTPPEIFAYRPADTLPDTAGWSVRVVANKYPALVDEPAKLTTGVGFYESADAAGVHEVIIESPEHLENMASLDESQLFLILGAYRERMLRLREDARWRAILVYKNHGVGAGASLAHLHSQLIALPMVPVALSEELKGAKKHYDAAGSCIYCEIAAREIQGGGRMVAASESLLAFCPYAPRFPYETWIMPSEHAACFEQSSDQLLAGLARFLRELLLRLDRALGSPPFNFIIHSNPAAETRTSCYHWHIEILPKLAHAAGFEWGSGSFINWATPEHAARLLREASA